MYTKSSRPKTQIRVAQALADAAVVAVLRAFLDSRIVPA